MSEVTTLRVRSTDNVIKDFEVEHVGDTPVRIINSGTHRLVWAKDEVPGPLAARVLGKFAKARGVRPEIEQLREALAASQRQNLQLVAQNQDMALRLAAAEALVEFLRFTGVVSGDRIYFAERKCRELLAAFTPPPAPVSGGN